MLTTKGKKGKTEKKSRTRNLTPITSSTRPSSLSLSFFDPVQNVVGKQDTKQVRTKKTKKDRLRTVSCSAKERSKEGQPFSSNLLGNASLKLDKIVADRTGGTLTARGSNEREAMEGRQNRTRNTFWKHFEPLGGF